MNEVELPSWVEDEIKSLAEESMSRQSDAWKRIVRVGNLLDPERVDHKSPLYKTIVATLVDLTHTKKKSLQNYLRLWLIIKGQEWIPANVDYSTALHIAQHGGALALLRKADEESWTLTQAKAWSVDKVVVKGEKGQTFWRYLTKAIPPEMRKAQGSIDVALLLDGVRKAATQWNVEHFEEVRP